MHKINSLEMSMSSKHTNHYDYFHTKRKFDDTKDNDKLSIPSDILKRASGECHFKK
jgi:hypothetical protein